MLHRVLLRSHIYITMVPDEDLPTLIKRKDHLQVLRYVRAHELREPMLVVKHGKALLGENLKKKLDDEASRLAALEQLCLAALDVANHDLAELSLNQLKEKVAVDSARFRRLLGRCLEAAGDLEGADKIYDVLLKENPACVVALQRKYCVARAQKQEPEKIIAALNDYLGQQMSDVSAWYEMATLRMALGDFKGAAHALEQVVLGCPLESKIHTQLAEVYATIGGLEYLELARKHMAQALELDATNVRAQFGLVSVANQYLGAAATAAKKDVDGHEQLVAKELVKYGAAQVLQSYKGTKMLPTVKQVMNDYTDNLEG